MAYACKHDCTLGVEKVIVCVIKYTENIIKWLIAYKTTTQLFYQIKQIYRISYLNKLNKYIIHLIITHQKLDITI